MKTLVYCEQDQLYACELIAHAKTFSENVVALCEAESSSEACFSSGADQVFLLGRREDDCAQASIAAGAIHLLAPDSVLFPATVRGRFLSAWAAAKLETGLTADCTALSLSPEGLLLQCRPAFSGGLMAEILCRDRRPQMASVRPGVYPAPSCLSGRHGPALSLSLPEPAERLRRLTFIPSQEDIPLSSAKVIVAGGKGIGGKRGFDKLGELARLLGGAVGATRSAVDAGYIGYEHQIGQTGANVHPALYLAFAISGAAQHLVGMRSAAVVLAVNIDRNAPIFSCADYGIVGPWEETVDCLAEAIKKRDGSTSLLKEESL